VLQDETLFMEVVNKPFWRHILKTTVVPFDVVDRNEFLTDLHQRIRTITYSPGVPRRFKVSQKRNGVARFIPMFQLADIAVYYFCVKLIEDEIAINRIPNTFGGWRLGNAFRRLERPELEEADPPEIEYGSLASLDPLAWRRHWTDYQKAAFNLSSDPNLHFFVNFDIANFYDSIKLDRLEALVRQVVSDAEKSSILDLLFFFLRNCNRSLLSYFPSSLGIPQDEVGDCSRLLANFYLQEYDEKMKEISDDYGASYLRYADDHIVGVRTRSDALELIYRSSRDLLTYGLNLNAHKVKIQTRQEFIDYWAFDIMNLLGDGEQRDVETALDLFIRRRADQIEFRQDTVIKRLLNGEHSEIAGAVPLMTEIILDPEHVSTFSEGYLAKLCGHQPTRAHREVCLGKLLDLSSQTIFSEYHLNLLRNAEGIGFNEDAVNRIKTNLTRVDSL
jgi:hypothetical protein